MSETITTATTANIKFGIAWDSEIGHHTEVYEAHRVDFWRDLLPAAMRDALLERSTGDNVGLTVQDGDIFPELDTRKRFRIKRRQFREKVHGSIVMPRIGRYYPRGLLRVIPGIYPQNIIPFRMVDIQNGSLDVDFNHPLAGKDIEL